MTTQKKTWRDLLLGEANFAFRRQLITVSAIVLLFVGVILVIRGTGGEGTIDVKMAVVEGKLQTGSIGLLFSFLGFLLLVPCFLSRTTDTFEVDRKANGDVRIKHKGVFMEHHAKAIRRLFNEEESDSSKSANKTPEHIPEGRRRPSENAQR